MTPKETEKIKLMQLFKQGKIDTLPDVDTAYMTKKMMDKEKNMEEADLGTLDRIDGLVDQQLLIRFLDMFTEIYDDLVVGGDPFEPEDVIEYLTQRMGDRATDSNMGADGFRSFEEEVNEDENEPPRMYIDDEEWEEEMGRGKKEESIDEDIEEQDINDPTYIPAGIGKQAITLDDKQHDQLMSQGSTLVKADGKTYPLVWTGFDKGDDEAGDYDTMEEETLDEGVEWFKKIAGLGK